MSLSRRSADVLLGLFLVSAVAVIVVALVFTQGWNERRIVIHMRTNSAQDLNVDTKVFMQGLEVGRLARIVPRVDSGTGALSFVATLRIRERYRDGAELRLPVGTAGEIRAKGALGGVEVYLVLPPHPTGLLSAGDTIPSTRPPAPLEAIARVADSVTTQVRLVLTDVRALIEKLDRTTVLAHSELAQTAPQLRSTLGEIDTTLAHLRPALDQATTFMGTADRQLSSLHDSVITTLAQTRALMGNLDSLTTTARGIAGENQAEIREIMSNLMIVSVKLDHFFDQVSRRPLRMITGVRALPPESLQAKP